MSDSVIISLASSAVSLMGVCFTAWMAYLVAKLKQRADDAAKKEEVTNEKLDELKVVTDTTHSLVNSSAIEMAKLYAISSRLNAHLTKDPRLIRIADEAEKKLAVMEASQARVDTKAKL